MIKAIDKHLDTIKKANKWINNPKALDGAKREKAHLNFVNYRRKLKKKKFALEDNPAAAIYGESQVGKSYLVSSLLSQEGSSFTIIDGNNKSHNFLDTINPSGGVESTSLVTRFSVDYQWLNPDFPVKVKLLSVTDLILVLCDSYYNDIKTRADSSLKSDQINSELENIVNEYKSLNTIQSLLGEDDILDIEDYFESNFATNASNVVYSNFFKEIFTIIHKISYEKWPSVFSLLWNKNTYITELFSDLLEHYKKLDFAIEAYLPMEAVMRDKGTLLDVARIFEIYGKGQKTVSEFSSKTSVLHHKNGEENIIHNFSKPYLCALAAELVFRLPTDLKDEKTFLKSTDLLDFPGARARLETLEADIDKKLVPMMLLRGKVAYLFNKYSQSEKVNLLLFCHDHRLSSQNVMPEVLQKWIKEMIGETSKDREQFISKSKVAPLFVVSTKFNMDLQYDSNKDGMSKSTSLDERWEKRFNRILYKEILGADAYKWIENWTESESYFKNIYLLRDFYYSSEEQSKIYSGYSREGGKELAPIPTPKYPDFRKDLRQSFIEYNFIKKHFKNPELSWDSAVEINQDGSKLIIENLTEAAKHINEARNDKNKRDINLIHKGILEELEKYHNSSDSAEILQKAKSKVGKIQSALDVQFGIDPCFFGLLMQDLMLDESNVFSLYQEKLKDIESRQVVNMGKYNGIRTNVTDLNFNDDFDTNLERLRKQYEFTNTEECKNHFENIEIDLNELFYGSNQRVKQFSQVLAESLEDYWFNQYFMENSKRLSSIVSPVGAEEIREMFHTLYKKLKITDIIAENIRHYVDGSSNIVESYEMVADISAEIVNRFTNTVGFEYYTNSDLSDLEAANKVSDLGITLDHSELHFETNTKEEAAKLIANMANLPKLLNQNPLPIEAKRLPNYRNYIMWYDRLKVGFVSVCNIPTYDVEANSKLKNIIDESKEAINIIA